MKVNMLPRQIKGYKGLNRCTYIFNFLTFFFFFFSFDLEGHLEVTACLLLVKNADWIIKEENYISSHI